MSTSGVGAGEVVAGTLFGIALSRLGFTNWDEVHRMFAFHDLRMFLAFCTAVVVVSLAWQIALRVSRARWSPRGIHRGTLAGGLLFGVGWALAGACPSVAVVQVGEGQLAALWSVAGIVAGNWLYSVVHERYFRWPTSGCLDE